MLRVVVCAFVCAGCGRFGFGDDTMHTGDGGGDAAIDVADAAPDAMQPSGLIAYYRFEDDPETGTYLDAGPGHHDAHCTAGSCPAQIVGHSGHAARFDGVAQFLRVTYGAWLDTPTGFTYSAWVFREGAADQVAFAKRYEAGSDDAWDFVSWNPVGGTGTCMEIEDTGNFKRMVCNNGINLDGTWRHVAARWNGAIATLFIGGIKVAQHDSAMLQDANDLVIGSDENDTGPAYYWRGGVDELSIYDRALSDQEIAMLAGS